MGVDVALLATRNELLSCLATTGCQVCSYRISKKTDHEFESRTLLYRQALPCHASLANLLGLNTALFILVTDEHFEVWRRSSAS